MKTLNDLVAINRLTKGSILTNTICFIMVASMMLYWLNLFINSFPIAIRNVFTVSYLSYVVFTFYEITVFGKIFEYYKMPNRDIPFGVCCFAATIDTFRSMLVLIPVFFLYPDVFTPGITALTFIGFMVFNGFLKKMLFPASLLVEIGLFLYAVSMIPQ